MVILIKKKKNRFDVEQALRHDFFKRPTPLFDEEEMVCNFSTRCVVLISGR